MIDKEFTKKVQDFLMQENRTDEQIIEGANLLFRINKNKALYQLVIRNPKRREKKVVYELNKHLKYRLDGLTLNEVRKMDKSVTCEIDKLIAENNTKAADNGADQTDNGELKLGKRKDHDQLPPEIQALWDINAQRYKSIKEARATVEQLDMPCDRYEYLKFMNEAYTAYKTDMAKYDSYKIGDDKEATSTDAVISSARAYISKNRRKYEELLETENNEDIEKLHDKIQARVDILVSNNAAISSELAEWLRNKNFDFANESK